MKATYNETVQMDWLLLSARAVLAEADELGAGRKVRITLYGDADSMCFVVPARVAAFARRVMGQPVGAREEGRVVFFTHGIALAFFPSVAGWERLLRALVAHIYAQQRATQRQLAINLAKIEANLNRLRGGEGKEVQS